jgi:hypothetical protein
MEICAMWKKSTVEIKQQKIFRKVRNSGFGTLKDLNRRHLISEEFLHEKVIDMENKVDLVLLRT